MNQYATNGAKEFPQLKKEDWHSKYREIMGNMNLPICMHTWNGIIVFPLDGDRLKLDQLMTWSDELKTISRNQ